jgi:DNA-binding response OmpR family regulator
MSGAYQSVGKPVNRSAQPSPWFLHERGKMNHPMRPEIFIVDDDAALARLLRYALEAAEFTVRTFGTAAQVLSQSYKPDLFLLDRQLPDIDGLSLCHEIRESSLWADVPVIFLTAHSSENDCIEGLRLADDYVIKPFSCAELIARIRAVLRRVRPQVSAGRFNVGDLELDADSLKLQVQGRDVPVTLLEFRLLEYFALNPGRTFRREQLLDAVWDARFVTPRTVDVHIRRLREKIEVRPDDPQYLQTIRGKGYRFAPPPTSPRSLPLAQAKMIRPAYSPQMAV